MLANCIFNDDCDQFGNTCDLTGDGAFNDNDLDIVLMVSIILEG